ncbi:hypothetical protein [Xanthomonas arboricola]|uniref:hypothetical protein n=1 Tax=Xanthomonas arboricola TaxID=56448 RepID=UPI0015E3282A
MQRLLLVSSMLLALSACSDNAAPTTDKADKPVPLPLFVHGGPWARGSYGG